MKNIMIGLLPVIISIVLVLMGCWMLPEESVVTEKDEYTKDEYIEKEEKLTDKRDQKEQEELEMNTKDQKPLIVIDAAYCSFAAEQGDEEEAAEAEDSEKENFEYEAAYQLACAVKENMENEKNGRIMVIQERNDCKNDLMKVLNPAIVVTCHIHKENDEDTTIYCKKSIKGTIENVFDSKIDEFDLSHKMKKLEGSIENVENYFCVEYGVSEDVDEEWTKDKAEFLSDALSKYLKEIADK